MPAYVIAEHIITDAKKFDEYRVKAAPLIARHGGRYLTKAGSQKMPEGGAATSDHDMVITLEGA